MKGPEDDKLEETSPDGEKAVAVKGDEILQVLKKGTEFTHELLRENERLRFKSARLEEELSAFHGEPTSGESTTEVIRLHARLEALEEEKVRLLAKHKEVEDENKDFAQRYVEIENQNNILANLYIASYQLHSTLDLNEVLTIILEIIINLIGAERFAILLLDEKANELKAVATEGLEDEKLPVVAIGEGPIGEAAKSGKDYFRDDLKIAGPFNAKDPLVCIPMKIKERVIGTLVIYSLLQQKTEFTRLDYELFTMLAGHTATALFSSKLYSESERKLSTIQGFIDLLTK